MPQNTVAIWGYFYGLNVPQTLGYVFGAVRIAIAGCLFLGLFRTGRGGRPNALCTRVLDGRWSSAWCQSLDRPVVRPQRPIRPEWKNADVIRPGGPVRREPAAHRVFGAPGHDRVHKLVTTAVHEICGLKPDRPQHGGVVRDAQIR